MTESPELQVMQRELFLASLIGDARGLGSALHRAAVRMRETTLAVGDVLFRLGERSDEFFFVVSGEIVLRRPGAAPSRFGDRSVVGGLDATIARPHTHTAEATKETRVLSLRASDWTDVLEDNFELARRVVGNLARGAHDLRMRPAPLGGFDPPEESRAGLEELYVVERVLCLARVPAFRRAGFQALAVLAQLGSSAFAAPDRVIFEAGETRDRLVVVASGQVSVAMNESGSVAHFGPGSLVGGAAALADVDLGPVRATVSTRAIVLPREDYFDVMEEHFDLVTSVLVALAEEREALLDRGS